MNSTMMTTGAWWHNLVLWGAIALTVLVAGVLLWKFALRRKVEHRNKLLAIGLQDIGELAVEEVRCTVAHAIKEARRFFGKAIPLTKSRLIFTYDATVKVGYDFADVKVKVDDAARVITLKVPRARILSTEIHTDSMNLLDEHYSVFRKIGMQDVNASLDAIRTEAQQKAVEGGCFERAAVSCQHQLQTFIGQFHELSQYRLVFQFRDGVAPEELPAEADDVVEEAQEA